MMTPEQHRQRHVELHKAVDELFADFIKHHPSRSSFLDMPLREFIEWSHLQTIQPSEVPMATLQREAMGTDAAGDEGQK